MGEALQVGGSTGSKQESSFFEKKEAKKLLFWYSLSSGKPFAALPIGSVGASGGAAGPEKSFFASFFSKKEDSCFLGFERYPSWAVTGISASRLISLDRGKMV